jgi:hypothetical protein
VTKIIHEIKAKRMKYRTNKGQKRKQKQLNDEKVRTGENHISALQRSAVSGLSMTKCSTACRGKEGPSCFMVDLECASFPVASR